MRIALKPGSSAYHRVAKVALAAAVLAAACAPDVKMNGGAQGGAPSGGGPAGTGGNRAGGVPGGGGAAGGSAPANGGARPGDGPVDAPALPPFPDGPLPQPVRMDGPAVPPTYDAANVPVQVLPVVVIEVPNMTPQSLVLHAPKVEGRMKIIEDHDGTLQNVLARPTTLDVAMGISLRGNSSSSYPQRSFSVEFHDGLGKDLERPVLGMPSESDWALVGCWVDKTCMRHAMAYAMGRELGRWNPRTRFVEVYFNTDYIGLYLLVEPPRRGQYRIPIPKVAPDATLGDLTGGYIFRREGPGKGKPGTVPPFDWLSTEKSPDQYGNQLVYTYHYPKEDVITPAQKAYLQTYVARFEAMMKAADWATRYKTTIDVTSWADFAIFNELSHNVDGYWKSVYYVKEPDAAGGRLHLTPLWDFNIAFGNADYREGWRPDKRNLEALQAYGGECDYQRWLPRMPPLCDANCCTAMCMAPSRCWNIPLLPFYWERLWTDAAFLDALKCRWQELRKGPINMTFVDARIAEWKRQIVPLAMPRHFMRWPALKMYYKPNPYMVDPTSAPNPTDTTAQFFDKEVTWFRNWIEKRIAFLDQKLPGTCAR